MSVPDARENKPHWIPGSILGTPRAEIRTAKSAGLATSQVWREGSSASAGAFNRK